MLFGPRALRTSARLVPSPALTQARLVRVASLCYISLPISLELVVVPQVIAEVGDVLDSNVLVDGPDVVSAHQREPDA